MTLADLREFIEEKGMVMESGSSSLPNVAELIAGESIIGSWWAHPKGHEIFMATRDLRASRDFLVCRLFNNKITYVHQRLWPAQIRLSSEIGIGRLNKVVEIHTERGIHEVKNIPLENWEEARSQLGNLAEIIFRVEGSGTKG